MVVVSVLLGVAVFCLAREIHSTAAGAVAAVLFYLTPLSMVWGVWLKTEQFATLVVVGALVAALRGFDRGPDARYPLVVGAGFGLAFLSRMVTVVHLAGFALFAAYYLRGTRDRPTVATARYLGVVGVGWAGVLAAGYVLIAWPSVATAGAIARQHVIELFLTGGSPSIAWVTPGGTAGPAGAEAVLAAGPIANVFSWETVWWLRSGLVFVLPVLAPLVVYTLPLPRRLRIPVWLVGAYAAGQLFGILTGLLVLFSLLFLWTVAVQSEGRFADRRGYLPAAVALVTVTAYSARGSLFTTYFQDVVPFLAVLAGIGLAELYRRADFDRQELRFAAGVLLLTATVAAPFVLASSTLPVYSSSVGDVQEVGADVQSRTDPGNRVFAAETVYVTEAERRPLADLSREYWVLVRAEGSEAAELVRGRILADLGTDRVPYVLADGRMDPLLEAYPGVERVVGNCYEHVRSYPGRDLLELNRSADCTAVRGAVGAGQ
jgi:4-amino-4-deoxy-L-arabinose transferase-like glycosyltransferase